MQNFQVFTSDLSGQVKRVSWKRDEAKNLNVNIERCGIVDRSKGINHVCYDERQEIIYAARSDLTISRLETPLNSKEDVLLMDQMYSPEEKFIGLDVVDCGLLAMTSKGNIGLFRSADESQHFQKLDEKKDFYCMKARGSQFAYGGDELDLKLCDLEFRPIFEAKNVRHDKLDMRVPIGITAIDFVNDKLVTGTKYGQLRLYDTKAQRRPMITATVGEYPIKTLTSINEFEIVYSDTVGTLNCFDLKQQKVKWAIKGIPSAVTDIKIQSDRIFSVGLDRMLRVHDLKTRKLIQKIYLKQQLTGIIVCELPQEHEEDIDEILNQLPTVKSRKRRQ